MSQTVEAPRRTVGGALVGVAAVVVSLLVFAAGLIVLYQVFQTANGLLNEPAPVLTVPAADAAKSAAATSSSATASAAPNAVTQIGADMAHFTRRLLTLLLLAIVGGIISSVGIQLFFRSRRA